MQLVVINERHGCSGAVKTLAAYVERRSRRRIASGCKKASAPSIAVGVHLRAPKTIQATAYWILSNTLRYEGAVVSYINDA